MNNLVTDDTLDTSFSALYDATRGRKFYWVRANRAIAKDNPYPVIFDEGGYVTVATDAAAYVAGARVWVGVAESTAASGEVVKMQVGGLRDGVVLPASVTPTDSTRGIAYNTSAVIGVYKVTDIRVWGVARDNVAGDTRSLYLTGEEVVGNV